jgi:CO/xanthine dehydrogenase Mo-binding subunit
MSFIGKETPLVDGREKVLGALRFCGNQGRAGMLHARLVTSPYAHARLLGLDREAALRIPGVVAVLTAADLPAVAPRTRGSLLLARDRVVFCGHPVALVLAEDEDAAQDGADAVTADYEPLPAVLDVGAALRDDAVAVWPEGLPGRSVEAAAHGADAGAGPARPKAASPNLANRVAFERGDLAAGFAAAEVIIEREVSTSAVHQSYLEPHVALVDPGPTGDDWTVYTSTQATFYVRDSVAQTLGLDHTAVRVVGTPVGGGFGGKFLLYEPLLALAARQIRRPIRLVLTRMEEMLAATPAPATRIRLRLGGKRDGSLVALDAELAVDDGCFPSSMAGLAGVLLGSSYRIPNLRVVGLEVLTHRPSSGAYRAPLAPQCAFALETALDELAIALELDPLELRLRNAAAPGDPMAMGNPWPKMGMRQVLEALARHPAWREREQARALGHGVGIAIGGWPGGTEPAAAACSLESDGTLQVRVGSVDLTGTNTSLGLIAAEVFGIDPKRVRVLSGDTTSSPYAGATGGSKILYTVGPAVMQAAQEARQQVLELAAETFEADPADLEIVDGQVQVRGTPDRAVPLAKLAQRTMRYGAKQAPVFARGRHAQLGPSPGFCAQLAEVAVDRETGAVVVHRLVVIQDVGRAINPLAVRGQMAGAAAQGIGWGLQEALVYDDQGQLLTATFADYALPRATDVPPRLELEIVEVPSESGPFGAKGVGEPPVIPTAAAIANAIADATSVRLLRLPMTAPSVLAALDRAEVTRDREAV